MKKFEYKTADLGSVLPGQIQPTTITCAEQLNEFGKKGWELVSVISVGPHSTHALAFLIRELE